jgi:YgiT-type zinc finger domain-containing protein
MEIKQCPSCGSPKIQRVRKNWDGEFRGKAYRVKHLEFYHCPDCGEQVFDRDAMRKIEARSPAFSRLAKFKGSAILCAGVTSY